MPARGLRPTMGSMATMLREPEPVANPREPVELLFRQLGARPDGLASREADRRLIAYGRNELVRQSVRQWPRELLNQVTHPLALLLWLAAALAFAAGAWVLGAAIVAVIVLNAVFAFAQERQAEQAIEALRRYLPQQALVLRDGRRQTVEAAVLVPGRRAPARRGRPHLRRRAAARGRRSRSTFRR